MLEEVRYYAQELLRLSERRQVVLNDMVALAQPLPEYDILRSIPGIAETTATSIIGELGDIRRFQSSNQITTSLLLVRLIPAISLTFMRNEKDNRQ